MTPRVKAATATAALAVEALVLLVYALAGAISGPFAGALLVIAVPTALATVHSLPEPWDRRGRWTAAGIAALVAMLGFRRFAEHGLFMSLTVAGIALGGVFALSGIGLVVAYRATGIFNFAHGAMAMFIAYVTWQLQVQWGWPLLVAAPLALLVIGPGLGIVLERYIFRPLQKRGASMAEKLVTTLGVFIVLVAVATIAWTRRTRTDPAQLFPDTPLRLDWLGSGVVIGSDQLLIIVVSLLLTGGLVFLFNYTALGTQIRAVVNRRELAELTSVNANRVSSISWALGAGLAGLTGVLLAPTTFGLDPIRLTLLVIETFSIAVVARLVSIPLAVVGGMGLGLLNAYAVPFSFEDASLALYEWLPFWDSTVQPTFNTDPASAAAVTGAFLDPVLPYLSVFLLFGALLVYKSIGEGSDTGGSFVARAQVGGGLTTRRGRLLLGGIVAGLLVLQPFLLGAENIDTGHQMIALAIVFLSIVAVTGFSGHLTLGQAAFAGFGGFVTARAVNGAFLGLPEMPVLVAMLIGGLACIPIGLAAGYPALRRRGLFLGLTTLALGLILERFVFQNFYFVGSASTGSVDRALGLEGDIAFYFLELALLGLLIFATHRLRSGRLGRILGAMRDSETAATAMGINLRRYKLFIFSASGFVAGIGGSLMVQRSGTFDGLAFITLNSLFWFAVVIVAGVTSIYGAILGAFIFTVLGTLLGNEGMTQLIIGLGALFMGRLPGGLVGLARRLTGGIRVPRIEPERVPATANGHATLGAAPELRTQGTLATAAGVNGNGTSDEPVPAEQLEASPVARALLARRATNGEGTHETTERPQS